MYEPPKAYGFRVVPVLPFLNGKELNDEAYSWIHSLRPSVIRISRGGTHADAYTWRVTIYLEKDSDIITRIEQEVQYALFGKDAEFEPGIKLGITIANVNAVAKIQFDEADNT